MSLDLFRERLGNARREKGMTQAELARRLGVTAQAVSKWERGNAYPDIELLDGIIGVLDCSPEYLFQYEKEAKSYAKQDSLERRAEIESVMLKDAIVIRFGYGLLDLVIEEKNKGFAYIHGLRKDMAAKYGFCVPTIRLMDSGECEPNEYQIFIYGNKVASGSVQPKQWFAVNKKAERDGDVEAVEPVNGLPGVWTEAVKGACHPVQFMMLHLERCIMENLPALFHCQIVADMVEVVEKKYPKVVQGVVPERVSLSFLKQVLLLLLCEKHYAVNHMIRIIEVLDETAEEHLTAKEAAERVAASLGEGFRYE